MDVESSLASNYFVSEDVPNPIVANPPMYVLILFIALAFISQCLFWLPISNGEIFSVRALWTTLLQCL
jgi:hypothetical protein